MTGIARESSSARVAEAYETPRLIVHGTVRDLTRGQGGEVPDTATAGSYLADGQGG